MKVAALYPLIFQDQVKATDEIWKYGVYEISVRKVFERDSSRGNI